MSRHTAGPSSIVPILTDVITIDGGGTNYGSWGDWVELIADTDFITTLLGVNFGLPDGAVIAEVQFGLGDEGSVEELGGTNQGIFTISAINGANGGPNHYDFPAPISGIPAHSHLWVRMRHDNGAGLYLSLRYAYDFDSEYCLDYNQAPIGTLPLGSQGVELTPSGDEWGYSDWVELTPGLSDPIGIASIHPTRFGFQASHYLYDVELGTGPAGFEQIIWAHPSVYRNGVAAPEPPVNPLTSLRYVAANTRIAVRLRKMGTATTTWKFKLNYYGPISLELGEDPPPSETSITVRKEVDEDSDDGRAFTFTAEGLTPSTFTLRNGEQQTFPGVSPGTYSIEEVTPDGWDVEIETSNNSAPTELTVEEGEAVLVTFRNRRVDGGGGGGDDDDLEADCIEHTLEAVNIALALIGISKPLTVAELEAGSASGPTAAIAQLHVRRAVDETLRDFPWPFATKYRTLTRLRGSTSSPANRDWTFEYARPSDCVFERRIVATRGTAVNPTPPPMQLSRNSFGDAIIWTNEPSAQLEYTSRGICPAREGDTLFLEALSWRFAYYFAPALSKIQDRAKYCEEMYRAVLAKAYEVLKPGNPGPRPEADEDAFDQTAAAIAANIAVVNRALIRINARTIVALDGTDQSREALAVRLVFEDELLTVLRAFPWAFATRYEASLTLVAGENTGDIDDQANADWMFSYRLPAHCVWARRLVTEGKGRTFNPSPAPFRLGSDDDGALLFTDEEEPILEFTKRIDEAVLKADPIFRDAFAWRLAAVLAPTLAQVNPAEVEQHGRGADATQLQHKAPASAARQQEARERVTRYAMSMYVAALPKATVADANEQEPQQPSSGDPDWITGR